MGHLLFRGPLTRFAVLAVVAVLGGRTCARAQLPLDDLRKALQVGGIADAGGPEALQYRRAKAKDAVSRMRTLGELRRALVLDEWKVDPQRVVNEGIRSVDLEL